MTFVKYNLLTYDTEKLQCSLGRVIKVETTQHFLESPPPFDIDLITVDIFQNQSKIKFWKILLILDSSLPMVESFSKLDGNYFAVLWPTDPKFLAFKDLNPF